MGCRAASPAIVMDSANQSESRRIAVSRYIMLVQTGDSDDDE